MVWALWRIGEPDQMLAALAEQILNYEFTDPLVRSFLLAKSEWQRDACVELRLEAAMGGCVPPNSLWGIARCICPPALALEINEDGPNPFYQRLARLVDYTADVELTPAAMLWRIECFGHVGQWLKVAGGDKAEVLEDALQRRPPSPSECGMELGAFVGYSAIRFARQISFSREGPMCNVSFEIDPVHALVSRHHLRCAALSHVGEIVLGQLQDTLPRSIEQASWYSQAFVFMDQRGTTFHEDLEHLEYLGAPAPAGHTTADNTTKPGAPVFLWRMAVGSPAYQSTLYAMCEFAIEEIEDWQSVSLGHGVRTHLPSNK